MGGGGGGGGSRREEGKWGGVGRWGQRGKEDGADRRKGEGGKRANFFVKSGP